MVLKIIGALLRKYRKEKNLTLAEVAKHVSRTKSYLSQIENGLVKSLDTVLLMNILEALEARPSEFYADVEEELRKKKEGIQVTVNRSDLEALSNMLDNDEVSPLTLRKKLKETIRLLFFSTEAFDAMVDMAQPDEENNHADNHQTI